MLGATGDPGDGEEARVLSVLPEEGGVTPSPQMWELGLREVSTLPAQGHRDVFKLEPELWEFTPSLWADVPLGWEERESYCPL